MENNDDAVVSAEIIQSKKRIRNKNYTEYMAKYMKEKRRIQKEENPPKTKKDLIQDFITTDFLEKITSYLDQTFPNNTSKKDYPFYILTIRYIDETYNETKEYCKNNNIEWIYSTKYDIPKVLCTNKEIALIFIEMNNTTNHITGIGATVYNSCNSVQYSVDKNELQFVKICRKDRSTMNHTEELVMQLLDFICFKGQGNHKNFRGLSMFDVNCGFDLTKFLTIIIRKHMHDKVKTKNITKITDPN
jgi:hypothetical protein